MHPVRLLLDLLPKLLVERRPLSWSRRPAASLSLHPRQPRRGGRRAPRQSRGPVPALPLPHHHELRQGLPEEPQSRRGNRRAENEDGRTAGLNLQPVADLVVVPASEPGPITTALDCC